MLDMTPNEAVCATPPLADGRALTSGSNASAIAVSLSLNSADEDFLSCVMELEPSRYTKPNASKTVSLTLTNMVCEGICPALLQITPLQSYRHFNLENISL